MTEIREKVNPKLEDCLPSHLIPPEMATDKTWNSHFRLFLEERAEKMFDLIKHYTSEQTTQMVSSHGIQVDGNEGLDIHLKPRLKDLLTTGKVLVGERVYIRKHPEQAAIIVDGDTVEFAGKRLPINTWGQLVKGWSSINIYNHVILERTGQTLEKLRELS